MFFLVARSYSLIPIVRLFLCNVFEKLNIRIYLDYFVRLSVGNGTYSSLFVIQICLQYCHAFIFSRHKIGLNPTQECGSKNNEKDFKYWNTDLQSYIYLCNINLFQKHPFIYRYKKYR